MNAVLFDMDATLLDIEVDIEAVRSALQDLFGPRGYSGGFAPILACIDAAASQVASGDAERIELVRRARGSIADAECAAAEHARARPGARESLSRLAGSAFGLITDNGRACVAVALRSAGLDHVKWRDDLIITRDEVAAKPAPDGVVELGGRLLPDGGALWYIGDSVRDVEAGRAAGAFFGRSGLRVITVAVRGGRSSGGQLRAAEPDHVIARLDELWSMEPWRDR